MTAPEIKLCDGNVLPQIGVGTWPMNDTEAATAVAGAIDLGYRLIDTAVNYRNEAGVGDGVRRSGIARDEVFITTKVPGRDHGYESTKRSLDGSLQRMQTDYVDLYLIHWPNPLEDKYVETWGAFVDLQKEGKVRSIGVSNFKPAHIERLREEVGVVPAVNQIQLYPGVERLESRKYHDAAGVVTESWSPLGRGANVKGSRGFLDSPVITAVAEAHGRSAAQVVLRWHVQQGLVPLPKSSNRQRLAENIEVFDFHLTADEVAALSALEVSADVVDSDVHQEM